MNENRQSPQSYDPNLICLDNIIFGLQKFGGISNYWIRIVGALFERREAGVRFVNPRASLYENQLASPALSIPASSEHLPARISRYLSFDAGDCRVAHTSYYRLPKTSVEKYIVTTYDFMYERYRKGPARVVHSWQKRRSLMAADVVVCISTFTRDEALRLMPGLDAAKLVVIPLGVDSEKFYPDPATVGHSLGRTVVFVGQRGGYKRFDLALGAVAQLRDLRLAIVGPPMSALEKGLAEKLIPGRWLELGQIDSSQLRSIYSSAYALVYPSDCEGFGLPVLEAMACGCPVVCSKLGSLPEVGGRAALFADEQDPGAYAEKLRQLDTDEARQKIITRGMDNTLKFTWRKTVSDTIKLYN